MQAELAGLTEFIGSRRRLMVLTGAGCSTESGIPDYRDASGEWKIRQPVQYGDFVAKPGTRRRYWARSLLGWRYFSRAAPNAAHEALARLEGAGYVQRVITQNVDGLHQAAGSRDVIDLHGRLDRVICLGCGNSVRRADFQEQLSANNGAWTDLQAGVAPDGDVQLERDDFDSFSVPDCRQCGGVLKPAVVFFGEAVPRATVDAAMATLSAADGLLVVGSSLMVFSGFRFARAAADKGIPIAALNLGKTRADDRLELKVSAPAGEALATIQAALLA